MNIVEYLTFLKRRRQFYQALIDLVPLEKVAIEKKEIHDINLLLTQKKILLNCIEEVEKQIIPFQKMELSNDKRVQYELQITKRLISQLLSVNNYHQKVLEHGNRSEQRSSAYQIRRDIKRKK